MINKGFKFRRFMKANCGGDAGQSLVEVALTVPLLLLLLMGGAEFASLGYAAIEVSNAAKAAVQYGAEESAYTVDTTGMQNAVNNEVTLVPGLASVTLSNATTTLACSNGTVPADGNAGGPYLNTDCASSHAMETLAVTTTATFTSWAVVNPLLKACNISTSFNLTGHATQVVMQ